MQTISRGVHQVSIGSNAFLVDGDEGVTLVDTGLPGREGAVASALAQIGRTWDDLAAIVVTHGHVDHLGSAAAIREVAPAATLAVSEGDAPIARGEQPAPPPPVAARLGPLARLFRFLATPPAVAVDHEVREGRHDGLPRDFTVLDTPGHTPGHVSYLLDRAGGVLFVGDAAVASRRGQVKRGFINAPRPDVDDSLRHIADHVFSTACFGHARPITSGASGAFRAFVAGLD